MAYAYSSGDGCDKIDGSLKVNSTITNNGAITSYRASTTQSILIDAGDANGIYITGTTTGGAEKSLIINNNGAASSTNCKIALQIAGSGKLTILNTGYTGIATGFPDQQFTVGGASAAIGLAQTTATPTLVGTVSSGAMFVSGGALWYIGYAGTQTRLGAS